MKPILQVEDDPNDAFLLQHAMKRIGMTHPVQVASDGQEAIDYVRGVGKYGDRENFPMPCLVLLDLKLPYVMGLEVLRCIRKERGAALPVIILTASAENADIAAAYRFGANAFLTKPSEAKRLEEMVKAIKDFWLTHNALPAGDLPESSIAEAVTLGRSSTTDLRLKPTAVIGARREHMADQLQLVP